MPRAVPPSQQKLQLTNHGVSEISRAIRTLKQVVYNQALKIRVLDEILLDVTEDGGIPDDEEEVGRCPPFGNGIVYQQRSRPERFYTKDRIGRRLILIAVPEEQLPEYAPNFIIGPEYEEEVGRCPPFGNGIVYRQRYDRNRFYTKDNNGRLLILYVWSPPTDRC